MPTLKDLAVGISVSTMGLDKIKKLLTEIKKDTIEMNKDILASINEVGQEAVDTFNTIEDEKDSLRENIRDMISELGQLGVPFQRQAKKFKEMAEPSVPRTFPGSQRVKTEKAQKSVMKKALKDLGVKDVGSPEFREKVSKIVAAGKTGIPKAGVKVGRGLDIAKLVPSIAGKPFEKETRNRIIKAYVDSIQQLMEDPEIFMGITKKIFQTGKGGKIKGIMIRNITQVLKEFTGLMERLGEVTKKKPEKIEETPTGEMTKEIGAKQIPKLLNELMQLNKRTEKLDFEDDEQRELIGEIGNRIYAIEDTIGDIVRKFPELGVRFAAGIKKGRVALGEKKPQITPPTVKIREEMKKGMEFACEICGRTFPSEKGLDIHRGRMHKTPGEEIPKGFVKRGPVPKITPRRARPVASKLSKLLETSFKAAAAKEFTREEKEALWKITPEETAERLGSIENMLKIMRDFLPTIRGDLAKQFDGIKRFLDTKILTEILDKLETEGGFSFGSGTNIVNVTEALRNNTRSTTQ